MIDYNFVPYRESLKLKNIGFIWECLGYYLVNKEELYFIKNKYNLDSNYMFSAPLYGQAFSWIRSMYEIHYEILSFFQDGKLFGYNMVVYKTQDERIAYEIEELCNPFHCDYKTYEEAEFGCLKQMIDLIYKELNND